jgi:multidrug efflux pump subunit AcrB
MADVEPQSDTNKVINVLKQTTLPELQQTYPGLSYSFEGRQADMRDSIKTLRSGLIVVLIVIYALLALMFRSYVQPLLVMFAIPFSIIGAVFGHFLMGYSMSIMSLFGLLALTGVVVNDSLVLIDFANHNRRRIDSVTDSLVEAAVRRFRPIMLTTLTTFVGLAPMIFETSRQARFLIPMALSLGFGIIFATMITLLFVPALYMIIEDIQAVLHRKPTVQNEAAEQPKMDFRTHC